MKKGAYKKDYENLKLSRKNPSLQTHYRTAKQKKWTEQQQRETEQLLKEADLYSSLLDKK